MSDDLKDQVGCLYPIKLAMAEVRENARRKLERLLKPAGWKYKPLRKVGSGYHSPRRGGASNQVDGLGGNLLAWLLYDDERALENARVRMYSLLRDGGRQDSGHVQRWDSALWCAATLFGDKEAMYEAIGLGLQAADRASNARYLSDYRHLAGGVRPQLRAMCIPFSFAHYIQRMEEERIITWKPEPSASLLRERARDALHYFFHQRERPLGSGIRQGFAGKAGQWRVNGWRDPVNMWPYWSSDSDYSIGDHEVPFHRFWIWPYEVFRVRIFARHYLTRTMRLRTRDVCDHVLDLACDEVDYLMQRSKRHTFKPSAYYTERASRGEPNTFTTWPEAERKARGENQYPPIAYVYASGERGFRLGMFRSWARNCKGVHTPGEIEPSLLWCASML